MGGGLVAAATRWGWRQAFFQAWGVPTSAAARKAIADLPAWMPPGLGTKLGDQ
jgi:hypothetical protein